MNTTVVIVEDETGAAEHLTSLLNKYNTKVRIAAVLRSVEESVTWFDSNPHPDLGLFDIQLNDGISFDIFERTTLLFPVIFTTAFNQYAIQAFRVNSVDYLLKPVKAAELDRALNKYADHQRHDVNYAGLVKEMVQLKMRQVFTFLVLQKEKLIPVPAADFSYFFISHGLLHGMSSGRAFPLSSITMDELEMRLDPVAFFRVSRQCIVNRAAIAHLEPHFQSRLALKLNVPGMEPVIVSKARTSAFKVWLSTGMH